MVAPSYEYIRAYRKYRDTAKERNGHAGYRDKYKFKSQKPPVGSRENPSDPKQEGTDAVYIPDTAKWMKK